MRIRFTHTHIRKINELVSSSSVITTRKDSITMTKWTSYHITSHTHKTHSMIIPEFESFWIRILEFGFEFDPFFGTYLIMAQ